MSPVFFFYFQRSFVSETNLSNGTDMRVQGKYNRISVCKECTPISACARDVYTYLTAPMEQSDNGLHS